MLSPLLKLPKPPPPSLLPIDDLDFHFIEKINNQKRNSTYLTYPPACICSHVYLLPLDYHFTLRIDPFICLLDHIASTCSNSLLHQLFSHSYIVSIYSVLDYSYLEANMSFFFTILKTKQNKTLTSFPLMILLYFHFSSLKELFCMLSLYSLQNPLPLSMFQRPHQRESQE